MTMYTRIFIMVVTTTCVFMSAMVKLFGIAIFCVCLCLREKMGAQRVEDKF